MEASALQQLISTGPAELLIASIWQGLLLTAFAWAALKLAPGLRASTRFTLWLIVFLLVALVGIAVASSSRRQAKQRAILERAAQAQGPLKLLDPKVLSVAMQAGRALGWQRVVPVALLGFLAAQWVQQAWRDSNNRSM